MGQQGCSGKENQLSPFQHGKTAGAKGIYEVRDFRDKELQRKTNGDGSQHEFIGKMIHAEDREGSIPHTHCVENLGNA